MSAAQTTGEGLITLLTRTRTDEEPRPREKEEKRHQRTADEQMASQHQEKASAQEHLHKCKLRGYQDITAASQAGKMFTAEGRSFWR